MFVQESCGYEGFSIGKGDWVFNSVKLERKSKNKWNEQKTAVRLGVGNLLKNL